MLEVLELAELEPTRGLLAKRATHGLVDRIWQRDASAWTGADEARWLGWLGLPHAGGTLLPQLDGVRARVRELDVGRVVLLGMGGSSLGAEALRQRFGVRDGSPDLQVVDTTDPRVVDTVVEGLAPERTLFVVASKSGSTLETDRLCHEMLARFDGRSTFWAITDPGSVLESFAGERGFDRVFLGQPDVGGRYSVLSVFGLVPAAAVGYDVAAMLQGAARAAAACRGDHEEHGNPGLVLGATMAAFAKQGRDKLTLLATSRLEGIGLWLEQLIAESLGKDGRGVVPIDREPLGAPGDYGSDRWFYAFDGALEVATAWRRLESTGQIWAHSSASSAEELGAELFTWQFAVAVAGALLGVHPFNQPDVESAKRATRELLAEQALERAAAAPLPAARDERLALFAPKGTAIATVAPSAAGQQPAALLRALLEEGDATAYLAVLAYLPENEATLPLLQRMRVAVRARRRWATTLGFGPRYLHSTGQLHKGGPSTGRFLVITAEPPEGSLAAADGGLGFGRLQLAQGVADASVLAQRGRKVLRVHLSSGEPGSLERGLEDLAGLVAGALA